MKISASIMTHPRRLERAEGLAAQLATLSPTVAVDPAPDGVPSALRAAAVAWGAAGDEGYHLVVQDDVTICADFESRLRALSDSDCDVVSLFADWGSSNGQAVRLAAMHGYGVAPIFQPSVPPQAMLMRAGSAQTFAQHCVEAVERGETRDSKLLWEFCRSRDLAVGICVPNLVQHDLTHEPSLWPGKVERGPIRSALFADDLEHWPPMMSGADTSIDLLPYIGWQAEARVTTQARLDEPTEETAALDWLTARGWEGRDLVNEFERIWRATWPVDPIITRPIMYQVFLAWAAVTVRFSAAAETPRAALATVAPGALRNSIDLDRVPELMDGAAVFLESVVSSELLRSRR
ncbi:hypothetical protein ACFV9C_41510 [Kribbella sp. NPDC059898]|uniref:hypothetical protein n=1 Tax=Kribbella sp. NPDC059898 TaxID=3346995 RepID=UPI003655AD61